MLNGTKLSSCLWSNFQMPFEKTWLDMSGIQMEIYILDTILNPPFEYRSGSPVPKYSFWMFGIQIPHCIVYEGQFDPASVSQHFGENLLIKFNKSFKVLKGSSTLSTSSLISPSYQGDSTIFHKGNFLKLKGVVFPAPSSKLITRESSHNIFNK